ncbi:hypothetical protein GDO78_000863 [Eleutherodactylus coqui]|uniref:Uncharacterized protein n=1 Tax=Eleutherodactylus coqui TaxID=57060 RepID=A0A8J6KG35_ELECQ|nr:hypothetical protein GDO78_000863 [Eleutherodactylus coqui]
MKVIQLLYITHLSGVGPFDSKSSLTKVDKSSHSTIFNRPSMDRNCLLSQAQEQEKFRQTGRFSTDSTPNHDLMIDRTEQFKEPEKNSKNGVDNEQNLMVYGKIAESNLRYEKLTGVDVSDGHQIGSVPGTKEDNADRNIGLAEETGFMESNTKAGIENELFIREGF